MPDAMALLNVDDTHHLEGLTWAVYDSMLLVGMQAELPGDRPWCTVLAGLHKHIYRGCDNMAHCLLHTLGYWDCQERIEVLHRGLDSAPYEVGGGEHPSPGEGPEAACNATPRWTFT